MGECSRRPVEWDFRRAGQAPRRNLELRKSRESKKSCRWQKTGLDREREGQMRLSSKVAIATGAGGGIGRATSLLLESEGAKGVADEHRLGGGVGNGGGPRRIYRREGSGVGADPQHGARLCERGNSSELSVPGNGGSSFVSSEVGGTRGRCGHSSQTV